jgi:hypothetical protein
MSGDGIRDDLMETKRLATPRRIVAEVMAGATLLAALASWVALGDGEAGDGAYFLATLFGFPTSVPVELLVDPDSGISLSVVVAVMLLVNGLVIAGAAILLSRTGRWTMWRTRAAICGIWVGTAVASIFVHG